jgi:hypothetical protein
MRAFLILLFIAIAFTATTTAQSRGIEGAWRLTEVTTTGANGGTKMMTQPSIYLFTKKHYSITYVSSDAPRPAMDDLSKATAAELRSVFVDSFIANAGTYEMKDGKLTTRPTVAKSPGFMQDGNFVTMSAKINGNVLTLTTESGRAGTAPNPTTYKLTRIE